jgi:hypothetical protein
MQKRTVLFVDDALKMTLVESKYKVISELP